MDIQVILASTVIATLITTIANMYTSKRTENLKYITEERQKWRKKIRKIAEDIADCPQNQIKKHLTALKVRINANGKVAIFNEELSYMEDSHIWELIKKLENTSLSVSEYEEQKDNLINTLSLLLKFDWERQKQEVSGSHIKKIHMIFYICVLLITIYVYGIPKDFSSESISPLYMLSILCISIPNMIFVVDEMLVNLLKRKKAFIFALVVTLIYFAGIGFTLYTAANIKGILGANNVDRIVKLLGGFLVVFSVLDFVLSCIYIFSPICKMERYKKAAGKVSGMESNTNSRNENVNREEQGNANNSNNNH